MKNFFTSDFHLDHNNIIKYARRLEFMSESERALSNEIDEQYKDKFSSERQAAMKKLKISDESTERMNTAIIDNINAVVGKNDILRFTGDFGFANMPRLKELRSRINCRIHFIWGNHDKRLRREWTRAVEEIYRNGYQGNLRSLYSAAGNKILGGDNIGFEDLAKIKINDQEIVLGHYAMAVWEKNHHGVWCVYGHSHSHFEPHREKLFPDAKMVDVGVDYRAQFGVGYTPWTFEELKEYMDGKVGLWLDHHRKDR